MNRRRPVAGALLGATAVLVAGCVTPARTSSAYEEKAVSSAEAAISAARTAVLAAQAFGDGKLFATSLEPVLVDAEETLGSVRSTFDSVQPPPADRADRLREQLDPLLEDAGSAATDMRVAARRGRDADLAAATGDLSAAADDLDAFAREHGP